MNIPYFSPFIVIDVPQCVRWLVADALACTVGNLVGFFVMGVVARLFRVCKPRLS